MFPAYRTKLAFCSREWIAPFFQSGLLTEYVLPLMGKGERGVEALVISQGEYGVRGLGQ